MPKKLASPLLILLSLCTGLLFLYSGFTKVYSLESYETFHFTIVEYIHLPWIFASVVASLMIGVEFALGGLIVLNLFGRNKWVLKAALALIVVFSIYLVYLWIVAGDKVNCGCFGDALWMSPSASLLKNAGTAIALLLLIRFHNGLHFRFNWVAMLVVCIAGIALPLIAYPPPDSTPNWLSKDHFQLDLSALYAPDKTDAPKIDLNKGKHVIIFVSLSCPHCRMAARKMSIMKENNPSLPFYLVYAGKDKYKADFFNETKATNIPSSELLADDFTNLVGFAWPVIYWIKDGWVEAKTNYIQLGQREIEQWLQEP